MQISSLFQLEIAAMDGSISNASYEVIVVNFLADSKNRQDFDEIVKEALRITLWHRCAVYEAIEEYVSTNIA